jgi:aspartyl-tRNA(Asn)/glutamyl-tRNA(Gln) amidotransferase subunit C
MSDPITPEVFNHLVSLAALELDREEGEYLRRQLNNQLKAIQELVAIPLEEDLPAAAHGVPYSREVSAPPRADTWIPCPDPDAILAQAPQVDDHYIVVPEIPHTELD